MGSMSYKENDYGQNLDLLLVTSPSCVNFAFPILLEMGAMLKVSTEDLLTLFIKAKNYKHSWKHKLEEWPSCFHLST